MIEKRCANIALHTNFDKTHLNSYFATEVLGLEGESEDFIFYSDVFMEFDELCDLVKEKMNGVIRAYNQEDGAVFEIIIPK